MMWASARAALRSPVNRWAKYTVRHGRFASTSKKPGLRDEPGEAVIKRLNGLVDADPSAAARLSKALGSNVVAQIEAIVAKETRILETLIPSRPTNRQLLLVMLAPMPLFIVFGIIDNAVMIIMGEWFDKTLGITFGLSTMAAAALGNLVSDVMGLGVGGMVEGLWERMGLARDPALSRAQESLAVVRRARFMGNAVGVSIGCLLGMFPLLFMDFDEIGRNKRRAQLNLLFTTVMDFVKETMEVETANLYVVDKDRKNLWTQSQCTDGVLKKPGQKLKFPIDKGIAGHCATSGEIINTSDPSALQKFGSKANAVSGKEQRSVLCTPIFGRHGKIIGVLEVSNRNHFDHFLVKDEVTLTSLSSHISFALEQAFEADDESSKSTADQVLLAMKASVDHQKHHLRYATNRAKNGQVDDLDLSK